MSRLVDKSRLGTKVHMKAWYPTTPNIIVHDFYVTEDVVRSVQYTTRAEYVASLQSIGLPPFNAASSQSFNATKGFGSSGGGQRLKNGPVYTPGGQPNVALSDDLRESLLLDALADAYDRAANYRSETAVGVDIGERAQTLSMLKVRIPQIIKAAAKAVTPWGAVALLSGAMGSIAKGMHADFGRYAKNAQRKAAKANLSRGRGDTAAGKALGGYLSGGNRALQTPATVASWWLEARLGWGPLVGSLDSAIKEFATNRNLSYVHRFVGRSNASDERSWSGVLNDSPDGSVFKGPGTAVKKRTTKVRVYVGINFRPHTSADYVGSPFDVAWELIPFSFVVDRFIGIGSFLKREAAHAGSKVVQVGWVVDNKYVDTYTFRPTTPTGASGTFACENWDYARSQWVDPPLHVLPRPKGWASFSNAKHVGDYVALVVQLASR